MGTVDDAVAFLGRVLDEMPEAAGAALYRRGEAIIADAKEHYVPVELGALRDSGYVEPPQLGGTSGGRDASGRFVSGGGSRDVTVVMGFGGPAADYALAVHEIPPPPQKSEGGRSATHTVGGWKYLETPALEAQQTMDKDLAADLLDAVKGIR
ncbi:MAG: hypothetical protein AB7O67_16565 [Vicinamibacterales bacterium]